MPSPAATFGDLTSHGNALFPGPGSTTVLIGGKRAWRAIADTHTCPLSTPQTHGGGSVQVGSPTVFIEGFPAARMGDVVIEAAGGPNAITTGVPTVLIA